MIYIILDNNECERNPCDDLCTNTEGSFFVHAAREANLAWPWMAEHASVKIYFLYF